MEHKLIITRQNDRIFTVLFEDNRAVEIFADDVREKNILGNIYVGKAANVAKNIQAAFVEIEDGIPCYFSMADNPSPVFTKKTASSRIVAGDEFLVQVSREGIKTKPPSVTSEISLSGKYLVLVTGDTKIHTSSKLPPSEAEQLLSVMEPFQNSGYGWILRTNASGVPAKTIRKEAVMLKETYQKILDTASHRTARSCVYRNPPLWLSRLKDIYSSKCSDILTDDRELFERLSEYLETYQPEDTGKLSFYHDRMLPLAKLYPVEAAINEALKERVWLKSGAYLVIQPTEALTAIDVNTGKYERGKKAEETFFKINLEAAAEIARQLRLRNLSGIILIDFINMKSQAQREELMKRLDGFLRSDPVKACVVDMTALGLVEVTRKRRERPLAEKLKG